MESAASSGAYLIAWSDGSSEGHQNQQSALNRLRSRVLSSPKHRFSKPISEREW